MLKIQILGESQSGNSYFVRVSEAIKTPFGNSLSELGVGYITKEEGSKEFSKGDLVDWNGNCTFNPITGTDGTVSQVNGQYLHRINLVSKEVPMVMPVKTTPVVRQPEPAISGDNDAVTNDEDKPF